MESAEGQQEPGAKSLAVQFGKQKQALLPGLFAEPAASRHRQKVAGLAAEGQTQEQLAEQFCFVLLSIHRQEILI